MGQTKRFALPRQPAKKSEKTSVRSFPFASGSLERRNMNTPGLLSRSAFASCVALFLFSGANAGAENLGQNWNRRYDQNTFLGTHNSFANVDEHYRKLIANQTVGVKAQLDAGVRCLSLDIFLVREKFDNPDFPNAVEFEMYTNRNQFLIPSAGFTNILPGIVLAHEPRKWGYSLFSDYPFTLRSYENIFTTLTDIREWMNDNLNEVVTIAFESYVAEPSILFSYFQDADLFDMIFFADRPNPGFNGPDGKAWNVPVHGWPRLSDMVSAGKRLVVFSGNGVKWNRYSGQPINGASTTDDDGMPFQWNFMSENEYGDAGIGTDGTDGDADESRNSDELDDMLLALSWMNWFPDANLVGPDFGGGGDPGNHIWDYGNLNSYKVISSVRDRFATAAKRYPNFVSVDFYHKGGDGGPRRLVRECNTYWANRPVVTATLTITPSPNIFGWRRSAQVVAKGEVPDRSMSVRWINSYWHGGNDILGHNEETSSVVATSVVIRLKNGATTNNPNLGTTNDGIFRVSAEAITLQGDRSDRAVAWVRIDNTPPSVQPVIARPPDGADGWYNHPVHINVIVADLLSGARHVWMFDPLGRTNFSEVYFSSVTNQLIERTFDFFYEAEGHSFIRFTAEDYAGNTNPANSGFTLVKMDRTPPVTSVAISTVAANTTVVLSAYETLSGTNGPWYQLDNATNWTAYTIPLVMSSAQPHTLRFYSRDLAGNIEEVRTFRIGQTAISLSAARNPAGYYQALDLVATITGPGPKPTGTVTFLDGTNVMGTATLDTNGTARLRLTPINYTLSQGAHQLTVRYNGNASYSAATSAVLAETVVDPPSVTLTASARNAVQTQPVVLTAVVSSGDERIPTGTVTFHALVSASGREMLGVNVPLDTNGHASITVDNLPFNDFLL